MDQFLEIVIAAAIAAIVTFFITEPLRILFNMIKRRLVSRGKNRLDLSGNWYGVWETTIKGKRSTQEETNQIKQRGDNLRIQNIKEASTKGDYAYTWDAAAIVYEDQYIIGRYEGRNVLSKGALFFHVSKLGDYMIGKWVGVTADSEFDDGYWVMARKRDMAMEEFQDLKAKE